MGPALTTSASRLGKARGKPPRRSRQVMVIFPSTRNVMVLLLVAASISPFLQNPSFSSVSPPGFMLRPIVEGARKTRQTDPTRSNLHRPHHFVIREFAHRVLSRHIVHSTVLVIGPDVVTSAARATSSSYVQSERGQLSTGAIFAAYAVAEGHRVNALATNNETFTIGDWWKSFDDYGERKPHWWSSSNTAERPGWILSAIIDLPFGQQDHMWMESSKFIDECTVTYIVTVIHSQLLQDDSTIMDGTLAAKVLLQRQYKLQVLQISHYHTYESSTRDTAFEKYGPNALLRTLEDIEDLLQWGARAARLYGGANAPFKAYIFATQGLDLAIPSRSVYLRSDDERLAGKASNQDNSYTTLRIKTCPQSTPPSMLNIRFANWDGVSSLVVRLPTNDNKTDQIVYYSESPVSPGSSHAARNVSQTTTDTSEVVWYSGGDIATSEAACVKFSNRSKCTSRVVPEETSVGSTNSRPNILLLLIDPISRGLFERSMPRTKNKLHDLGFVHFPNYSVVGGNSGPNQAALYSGIPLSRRDGISKETERMWLWDRLRRAGYKTLKAEDGCIENSNMVQSLKPNTTHGEALSRLFCFDFDRPNCIGPDLASALLLDYGEQFVTTYHGIGPWAGFLHFVDTHEDTMILSAVLDSQFQTFLQRLHEGAKFNNTIVVFCSDHGLHYGPYFQARHGRKERSQPVLYVRIPESLQRRVAMQTLAENSKLWTTAFDLHETIVQLTETGSEVTSQGTKRRGKSLFEPLPGARRSCVRTAEIPDEYCEISNPEKLEATQCTRMPSPPSVLSFFADIPQTNRPTTNRTCFGLPEWHPSDPSTRKDCECATSHRAWHNCTGHPWGSNGALSRHHPHEYFALAKCRGERLSIDTRVLQQSDIRAASSNSRARGKSINSDRPSLLMLGVDSVANDHAGRDFPLTRDFLKSHQPQKDRHGELRCKNGICATDFRLFGLLGSDSLTNRIPVLSGCLVNRFHCDRFGMDGAKETNTSETLICQNEGRLEYGLRLFRQGPRHAIWCPTGDISPLLFDLAKKEGYVTFSGGGFSQDDGLSFFPLHADIELQNLHRLSRQRFGGQCAGGWSLAGKTRDPGLDIVTGIWNAYPKQPKFAYTSAVAFDDFNRDWIDRISRLEAHDSQLLEFLLEMLGQIEVSNTIIILCSNHGMTHVIFPQNSKWVSMQTVLTNQDRLTSGFDLYRTVRELIRGPDGATPEWSFNLLKTPIPSIRSCKDARIRVDFCPCEEEVERPPAFGVCHTFDNVFCPEPESGTAKKC